MASEARRARYSLRHWIHTPSWEVGQYCRISFWLPMYTFCKMWAPVNICCIISRPRSAKSAFFLNKRGCFLLVGLCAQPKSIFKTNSRLRARHMINLTQQLEALFCTRLGVGPRLKLWMMHNCVRSPTHTHNGSLCYISASALISIYMRVCSSITYYLQTGGAALVKFSSLSPLELLNGLAAAIAMMLLIIPHHYIYPLPLILYGFQLKKLPGKNVTSWN